ncbi:hypothetical protein LTR66_002783 [Elasticomyces elasticus]|nr:hypothetical protein LTR66_002783 [Elasticomyces elasticus]
MTSRSPTDGPKSPNMTGLQRSNAVRRKESVAAAGQLVPRSAPAALDAASNQPKPLRIPRKPVPIRPPLNVDTSQATARPTINTQVSRVGGEQKSPVQMIVCGSVNCSNPYKVCDHRARDSLLQRGVVPNKEALDAFMASDPCAINYRSQHARHAPQSPPVHRMVITRQSSFDVALDKVNNVVEKGSLKLRKASADLVKVAERLVPRKDSVAKPQEIPTSPSDFLATNQPRRPYVPGGRPNEDELRAARSARDRLAAQRARAETEAGPSAPRPQKPNIGVRSKFTEDGLKAPLLSPPRAPQSGDPRSTMRVRSRTSTSPPPKDRVSAAVDTVVESASHMLRHKVSDESFFDQGSSVPGHMELCRICGEDTVFGWDGVCDDCQRGTRKSKSPKKTSSTSSSSSR